MDRFGTEEASRERLKGGWPVIPLPRLGDLADTIMARWPDGGQVSDARSMAGLTAHELVWLTMTAILADTPPLSRDRIAEARRGLARHAHDDQEIVCAPIALTVAELMALIIAGEAFWRDRAGRP